MNSFEQFKNTYKNIPSIQKLVESLVKQTKKTELFDYKRFLNNLWNPIIIEAQKFQKISFDLENNESTGDKRKIYIKRDLRVDQPIKYEISCELCEAGGDWQIPACYFKIQINYDYSILNSKYQNNPEYVFDVKGENYSRPSKCYVMIPPVEAGNKLTKTDKGYYAYNSGDLAKNEWKYTKEDFDKMWKWIEDTFEKIVEERHEMLDRESGDITHIVRESRSEQFQDLCWKNAKVGDIVDESDVYQYAQSLHRNYDDFHEGDLGDRIENYKSYKLTEIDIDKLDLDEWDKDEDLVEAIEAKIEKTGTYPPIIIDRDFCIILSN